MVEGFLRLCLAVSSSSRNGFERSDACHLSRIVAKLVRDDLLQRLLRDKVSASATRSFLTFSGSVE